MCRSKIDEQIIRKKFFRAPLREEKNADFFAVDQTKNENENDAVVTGENNVDEYWPLNPDDHRAVNPIG